MTAEALLGALVGTGLLLVLSGLRRRSMSLADTVEHFQLGDRGVMGAAESPRLGIFGRLGGALAEKTEVLGHPLIRDEDLAITGRDRDRVLANIGMAGVSGACAASGLGWLLGVVGVGVPRILLVAFSLSGGALGCVLPSLSLKQTAKLERERFVKALGCWLELVAMAQAGGMGIESALQASSEISLDSSFARLRIALDQVRVGALTPWQALGRLGRELGVADLEELAATLSLAGTEGARVRSTLVAKSASLRRRQMSKAEAEANSTTERLFLPSVVLMIAFMVFLMYPAGVRLAHII